jgi:hypothetical protein
MGCKARAVVRQLLKDLFKSIDALAGLVTSFLPSVWENVEIWRVSPGAPEAMIEMVVTVELAATDSVLLLGRWREILIYEPCTGKLLQTLKVPDRLAALVSLERDGCFVALTNTGTLRVYCVPSLACPEALALDETQERFPVTGLRALSGGLGCAFVSRGRELGIWVPGYPVTRPVRADELKGLETSGCMVGYHRRRRTSWAIEILNAMTGRRLLTLPSFPMVYSPVCRGVRDDEFVIRTWDQQLFMYRLGEPNTVPIASTAGLCTINATPSTPSLSFGHFPSADSFCWDCAARLDDGLVVVLDRGTLRIISDGEAESAESVGPSATFKRNEIALRAIHGTGFCVINLRHGDVSLYAKF